MRTLQENGAGAGARVVGTRAWAIGAIIIVGLISGFKAGVVPGGQFDPDLALNDDAVATVPAPTDDAAPFTGPLRLHAVVHGRDAIANVNGHVVRLGQTFAVDGARYTVRAITPKSVTLTTDAGDEIMLRLRSWQLTARR